MKIAIGADHAGYQYKQAIIQQLESHGHIIIDKGTNSEDSVDYPDFIHPVAKEIENDNKIKGIIICGSGNGVAMTANKHQEIRAAICWSNELASLARKHNDANIISIPARIVALELAISMVHTFLNTEFEAGRHQRRVNKIACT